MKDFTLYTPTYLVFGDNKHKTVGSLLKGITSNVLIHYGSSRIVKQGLLKEVTDSLEQNNISYTVLGGVVPNPRIEKVYEGIKLVKEH
ncbi:MAG: iron-containing alcohol dehydrogenase, partial [Acholeplasmatales bacterium]|nr:iron-containing alcohol dehydrogenase [Acholeplasmatales bacterium]